MEQKKAPTIILIKPPSEIWKQIMISFIEFIKTCIFISIGSECFFFHNDVAKYKRVGIEFFLKGLLSFLKRLLDLMGIIFGNSIFLKIMETKRLDRKLTDV